MRNRGILCAHIAWPAILALLLPLLVTATSHSQCHQHGCHDCKQCGDCLSPTPVLESECGWSLYWHNPCDCVDDPCVLPSCPLFGTPTWYVMGELLPLFRDQLDGRDFQFDGTTGDSVLRESQFRSEFAAGARVMLGRSIGDWYRLETSYFGSHHWNDELAIIDAGENLLSPFTDFGDPAVPGLDSNNFASVSFSSELDNVELNLRRRLRLPANGQYLRESPYHRPGSSMFLNKRAESSFLLGIRYLRVEEDFAYRTESNLPAAGTVNLVDTETNNDMIGAQIGWLSQFLYRERGWFDVELKGGIFQNRVSLDISSTGNGALPAFADSDERDRTAWVGELSLVYNHQFARSFSCRVGYNALWIGGLALASENFSDNADLLTVGQALVRHNGDIVYHGPSLGLVWTR